MLTVVTTDLDRYFRWDEPDCDLSVCLNLATADRLQREALRGLGSSPAERHEVGGILLGKTRHEENRTLIFIDDFEAVSCSPRKDRVYTLSPADRAKFEAALTLSRTLQTPEVIGYYRSHNRDGMFLSADDLSLIERNFRAPEHLFLLIKPGPNRACTAGSFFRKNGQIRSEFTDSEIPLIPVTDESPLEATSPAEAAGSTVGVPPPGDTSAEVMTAAPPAGGRQLSNRVSAIVLAIAIAVAGILLLRHSRSAPKASRAAATTTAREAGNTGGTTPPPAARTQGDASRVPSAPHVATSEPSAARTAPPVSEHNAGISAPPVTVPSPPPDDRPSPTKPGKVEVPKPRMGSSPDDRPRGNDAIPAEVLQRVTPEVPPDVAAKLTTDVRVTIEVAITGTGEVSEARVISTDGAFAELLTDSALRAARQFRFRPAEVNGHSAPSSMVLVFRFRPANR